MSVRNLVEIAVIPPMLAGVYYVIKAQNFEQNIYKFLLIGGMFFGIAFAMRFQSGFVPIGIGCVMLFRRQFKSLLILSLSAIFVASLFLGLFEYILWDRPF